MFTHAHLKYTNSISGILFNNVTQQSRVLVRYDIEFPLTQIKMNRRWKLLHVMVTPYMKC